MTGKIYPARGQFNSDLGEPDRPVPVFFPHGDIHKCVRFYARRDLERQIVNRIPERKLADPAIVHADKAGLA